MGPDLNIDLLDAGSRRIPWPLDTLAANPRRMREVYLIVVRVVEDMARSEG